MLPGFTNFFKKNKKKIAVDEEKERILNLPQIIRQFLQ